MSSGPSPGSSPYANSSRFGRVTNLNRNRAERTTSVPKQRAQRQAPPLIPSAVPLHAGPAVNSSSTAYCERGSDDKHNRGTHIPTWGKNAFHNSSVRTNHQQPTNLQNTLSTPPLSSPTTEQVPPPAKPRYRMRPIAPCPAPPSTPTPHSRPPPAILHRQALISFVIVGSASLDHLPASTCLQLLVVLPYKDGASEPLSLVSRGFAGFARQSHCPGSRIQAFFLSSRARQITTNEQGMGGVGGVAGCASRLGRGGGSGRTKSEGRPQWQSWRRGRSWGGCDGVECPGWGPGGVDGVATTGCAHVGSGGLVTTSETRRGRGIGGTRK